MFFSYVVFSFPKTLDFENILFCTRKNTYHTGELGTVKMALKKIQAKSFYKKSKLTNWGVFSVFSRLDIMLPSLLTYCILSQSKATRHTA